MSHSLTSGKDVLHSQLTPVQTYLERLQQLTHLDRLILTSGSELEYLTQMTTVLPRQFTLH